MHMKDYHALSYRLKIWYIRENKDSEKEREDRDKLLEKKRDKGENKDSEKEREDRDKLLEKKRDKGWDKDKDSMLEILLISLDMAGFLI